MDGERKLCEIYGGGNRHKFREFLSGSGRMEDRKIQSHGTGIRELGGRRSKILQQEAFGTTYEEVNKRDVLKREFALNNGIKHYIEIDARKSEFNFIKHNIINSKLKELIDLSIIDWEVCYKETIKPIIPLVCELWNKGYCNSEIIEKIPILDIAMVSKYLNVGNEIGLCHYNGREGMIRGRKLVCHKVKCKTTGRIFNSIKDAIGWCGLKSSSGIIACCNGYRNFAGQDPSTKEKLQWEYL